MLKKITRWGIGFGVAVVALATSSAQAQTLSVYFTLKTDTTGSTKINTASIGAINSTLALSVWMKTSGTYNALAGESYLAFDRTTSTNPDTAVLSQKKIGLVGDSLSALTPSSTFGINNGVYYDIDSNVAPSYYGVAYDFGASGGTPVNMSTAKKLYDINLYNRGLASGSSYIVRLINNGTTQEFQNNFLVDAAGTKLSGSSNLTITAVPEPATLAVFGFGLLPFLRRRRKANVA